MVMSSSKKPFALVKSVILTKIEIKVFGTIRAKPKIVLKIRTAIAVLRTALRE